MFSLGREPQEPGKIFVVSPWRGRQNTPCLASNLAGGGWEGIPNSSFLIPNSRKHYPLLAIPPRAAPAVAGGIPRRDPPL